MPQPWFEILAIVALAVALGCAALILADVLTGHAQMMGVMNWVWPITALYFGPVAIFAYRKLGRPMSHARLRKQARQSNEDHASQHREHTDQPNRDAMMKQHHRLVQRRPFWQTVWLGVTHCGAGCTLGDLVGEWAFFIMGVTLAGEEYWPFIMLDFTLAYLFGIIFQYFSIAPMRGISGLQGIWAAMKADTLSLIAFELGLFGWMALSAFVLFPDLHPANPAYWFMMQIGMVIGFATSYPMNWWLISHGIKEPM